MSILLILVFGIVLVFFGRAVFGRFVNPVGLYAVVWTISLALFEVRLIRYYDLEPETWLVIYGAWCAYTLGAVSVVAARFAAGKPTELVPRQSPQTVLSIGDHELKLLEWLLWILNVIAILVVLQHWGVAVRKYGSISNVILLGNLVYSERVSEGLPGTVPYLDAFAMVGAILGGVYTGLSKRFKLATIIPLLALICIDVLNMGRLKILFGGVLFFGAYGIARQSGASSITGRGGGLIRRLAPVVVVIALVVGGAEFVRSVRGAIESLPAATTTLQKMRGSSIITPSIYLYLSVDHGVLNQYLRRDEEHTPWGSNTFAPVYRVLGKFGFDTNVPVYQRFYFTPVGSNTGTYLRELHADFGLAGVFLAPYLLGCAITALWYRVVRSGSYSDIVLFVHVLLAVMLSFFIVVTRAGDWWISLFLGLVIAHWFDRRRRPHATA